MSTTVINFLGGSGLGKSTTAAGLYYHLKLKGYNAELVQEYVKRWAWEGRKITPMDQTYIFGKQSRAESLLYGKVSHIVTDSPLLLAPIYELYYNKKSIVIDSVFKFITQAQENGVVYKNYLLTRHKPFDSHGRYETEEQAKDVDAFVNWFLNEYDIPYTRLKCEDEYRVDTILRDLA